MKNVIEVIGDYKLGLAVDIIVKKYKISLKTIYDILKKNNIKLRGRLRKLITQKYWEKSYNLGYVIGLMFSDGCFGVNSIGLNGTTNLGWAKEVSNLLEKWSGVSISFRKYYREHIGKEQYNVILFSKEIRDFLFKLTKNKTHIPRMSREEFRGFLSAVIDGDGSIDLERKRIRIVEKKDFLINLKSYLEKRKFIINKLYPFTNSKVAFCLHISNVGDNFVLLENLVNLLHPEKKLRFMKYYLKGGKEKWKNKRNLL